MQKEKKDMKVGRQLGKMENISGKGEGDREQWVGHFDQWIL